MNASSDPRSYQITIKGLCFDAAGRVLLVRERSGVWELPGGRIEHGEDFHTALRRECREEMGLDCTVLDAEPYWAWTALGSDGLWKAALCYRISLPHLDFTPSEECVEFAFVDADGLSSRHSSRPQRSRAHRSLQDRCPTHRLDGG